jgi:hypothetical protein
LIRSVAKWLTGKRDRITWLDWRPKKRQQQLVWPADQPNTCANRLPHFWGEIGCATHQLWPSFPTSKHNREKFKTNRHPDTDANSDV